MGPLLAGSSEDGFSLLERGAGGKVVQCYLVYPLVYYLMIPWTKLQTDFASYTE